jgi:hypothetical protein
MRVPRPIPPRPDPGGRPLVRIERDVLPGPLFARLARAVRALGGENLRRTYQTTFWFDLGRPAALPELAILALRERVGARDAAGVEWWLSRMRTSDVQVDFHRDRDEALYRRRGVTVHPALTSVLFLNRCRGGLLAVVEAPPSEANAACAPDRLDGDLVRPWPNRLAIFPGGATHGVLDANNRIPDGPLRHETPLRLVLVMNWWARRPMRVPSFVRSKRYRTLRLPGSER